jgi:hypothetical protein
MPSFDRPIDLTTVDFPSDLLTIKALRGLFPDKLNLYPSEFYDFDEIELPAMLEFERSLASRAFNAILGKSPQGSLESGEAEEDREMLAAIYTRYGMASGPHHAEQLIRAFEQSAAEQARRHAPKSPPR